MEVSGVHKPSPPLWSEDQGFLPAPTRTTDSPARNQTRRRGQDQRESQKLTVEIWSASSRGLPSPRPTPAAAHTAQDAGQQPRKPPAARSMSPLHPRPPPRRPRPSARAAERWILAATFIVSARGLARSSSQQWRSVTKSKEGAKFNSSLQFF
jgi:hypothetical protein